MDLELEKRLFYQAKGRAKKLGLPFDLELSDIVIPETCPMFGTTLERGGGLGNPNLASLDRIEPAKGYVKGNVWIISWRANKLKCDASVAELTRLVEAIRERLAA